jgi:hypothetical protein
MVQGASCSQPEHPKGIVIAGATLSRIAALRAIGRAANRDEQTRVTRPLVRRSIRLSVWIAVVFGAADFPARRTKARSPRAAR